MSAETVFVIVSVAILSFLLFYEIVFLLFYRKAEKTSHLISDSGTEDIPVEDIIVQPKPLGYGEILTGKYEQCKTPVFEMENPAEKEEAKNDQQDHLKAEPEKDHKKAPTIVVTSPTL